MGLGGFAWFWALEFRFRVGQGPKSDAGVEPATFPSMPHEIAARPMRYPAIAQRAGGCLKSHSGESRGLNPFGPFPQLEILG